MFSPSLVFAVRAQHEVLVDHDGELEPRSHLDRRGDVELPVDYFLAGPVQVRSDTRAYLLAERRVVSIDIAAI
jgi:hypothetical protein